MIVVDEGRLVDVVSALGTLDTWLAGGWGIDALIGYQTRPHHDVDLLVPAEQFEPVLEALGPIGFSVLVDERPDHVLFVDLHGNRLDLQLLTFVASDAYLHGADGWFEYFPNEGFMTGTVAGRRVGCLSPSVQIEKHRGYPPRDVDRMDLELLDRLLRQPISAVR